MTKYPRLPRSVCGSKQSIHWRWVPPLFHNYFSPSSEQPNNVYQLISGTANCRLYSNISQTLPLYKVWGYYYNKFDSMKSFGVYHWYVKMPPCGCVEHGLEYITFYVKQGKSEGFDSCDRPSNLKLDSNRQFFRPCDREIWRMTLQYNRAPLLCYFKLCASFCSHWWIQTSITVRKRPIWVKFDDF